MSINDIFGFIIQLFFSIFKLKTIFWISYLRKKGVLIGQNTEFFGNVYIDITRPCLIEIGRNCILTDGVTILTHGLDWTVLRELYGEVLSSSGKVVIGDNVFIGMNSIILKGTRIGKNSIIGAGSVVTHNIPPNSVAAGNPCKVITDIDSYYQKRKKNYLKEAVTYARELYKKNGKRPTKEMFREEFPLFLNPKDDWGKLPVKQILGSAYYKWTQSKPIFTDFNEFLSKSGIPDKSK